MSEQDIFGETAPSPFDGFEDTQPGHPQRRLNDPVLALVKRTYAGLAHLDKKVTDHMESYRIDLDATLEKIAQQAVPDGDWDGHRRAHEAAIRRAEEQAEFWKAMRIAGAKWAGLGLLGLFAAWMWSGFVQELLKAVHK
jgi:hypothetical protein